MITVCVPGDEARDVLAGLDGVEVVVWNGTGSPPAGVERVTYLLASYTDDPTSEQALSAMPALQTVQVFSAGVDDWLARLPDGVRLANGRGIHGGSTAELAVAGLLAVLRELPFFAGEQAARRWSPIGAISVEGASLLVLGAGDIGVRVAAALAALGARPTLVARSEREGVRPIRELAQLLADAELVVIALPLTEQTRGLVDASFLRALPDGAVLVNVARGAIVDTDALVAECASGRLRAFVDNTDPEPLPPDHALWHTPGVLITPHVGGGTDGWRERAWDLLTDQVRRLVAGRPLRNLVGPHY